MYPAVARSSFNKALPFKKGGLWNNSHLRGWGRKTLQQNQRYCNAGRKGASEMHAFVLYCVWDSGGTHVSPGRDFLKSQPDTSTGSRSLRPDSARRSGMASLHTRRCPSHNARQRSQGGTCNDSRLPSPERKEPGLTSCSHKFDQLL